MTTLLSPSEQAISLKLFGAPPKKNIPKKITDAMFNALHLFDLPKKIRRTYAECIRFVSQHNIYKTIFAYKQYLADEIGISVAVLYRHLNFLVRNNWINRFEQKRKTRNGRFSGSEISLTAYGAQRVGLIQPETPIVDHAALATAEDSSANQDVMASKNTEKKTIENEVIHKPPSIKMRDGHTLTVLRPYLKEASFKEEAFNKKTEPQKPKTNHKKIHLSPDLEEIVTKTGILPAGICKLMSLAKLVKQRLQDVWKAKREQILSSGATGGRAFQYIKFLLETGEDFSYRARNAGMKNPTATSKTSATSTATAQAIDHRIYWNKRFIDGKGVQVRIHGDGSAAVTDGMRKNDYVRPADVPQIYAAIAAGRLWLLEE